MLSIILLIALHASAFSDPTSGAACHAPLLLDVDPDSPVLADASPVSLHATVIINARECFIHHKKMLFNISPSSRNIINFYPTLPPSTLGMLLGFVGFVRLGPVECTPALFARTYTSSSRPECVRDPKPSNNTYANKLQTPQNRYNTKIKYYSRKKRTSNRNCSNNIESRPPVVPVVLVPAGSVD